MHEYPITCQLVRLACLKAAEHGAGRVCSLHLVVGDDAGYAGDSVQFYFHAIAAGTACEGAELHIERIRPELVCPSCGRNFFRKPFSFACPSCGTDGHPTAIGKEFYLQSIEIDHVEANKEQAL
jgi:hydrogenase nickel incorporation protein HypA/HybF